MNNLQTLLNRFVIDPENDYNNLWLAEHYHSIGQTASAVSYYTRTAERTEDQTLMYASLLAASDCFHSQGCRNNSVKGLLQSAIALCPKRPEGYFLLSRFYEREQNWHDSYLIASIGIVVSDFDCKPLPLVVDYPGKYGVLFEKAVSSWHCGLCDESRDLLIDLKENYKLDKIHSEAVENNLRTIGFGSFMLNDKFKLVIDDHKQIPKKSTHFNFSNNLNLNSKSTSWIVDNFYDTPDAVREFALQQEYVEGGFGRGFIGRRTEQQFLFPNLKERFESIMGRPITKWEEYGMNGRFQISWSGEPLVYHCDNQQWGGMLYLTPNAPYQCGTTLYAHKQTRARTYYEEGWDASWKDIPGDPHLDGTPWEPVDVLGNVYNRLVIFDASAMHSASQYFGTVKENARLWQMFFFDAGGSGGGIIG